MTKTIVPPEFRELIRKTGDRKSLTGRTFSEEIILILFAHAIAGDLKAIRLLLQYGLADDFKRHKEESK
jgi:hypothetical protein